MKATRIIRYTLVAFNNCFSVLGEDGKEYKVVNFYHETMEKLPIEWPVEIKVLEGHVAVIHDARVPDKHYNTRFCEVCCPKHLLPTPQLLGHERQIARGQRVEHENGSVSIYPGKVPDEYQNCR